MSESRKDTIRDLGALGFASRLRRLSDRLARDISRVYSEHKVEFEARWFPVTFLLTQKSPLAVTEIAERLGFTHPAVNQIAGQMEKAGLLKSTRDRKDDRRRLLSLTPKGKKTVKQLEPLWAVIRDCTAQLLSATDASLLESLTQIESNLDSEEMYGRVTKILYPHKAANIEIVDYKPQWAHRFRELNEEWLMKHFSVEPLDQTMLENPQREILKGGGAIFFVKAGGDIIGTAALIRHSADLFEIAKMAVSAEYQNRGIGAKLLEHLIHRARVSGAEDIVLATSLRLKSAVHLYRRFGFRKLRGTPGWASHRVRDTIYMKLKS